MKKRICAALLAAVSLLGALNGCGAAESQTDAADAALLKLIRAKPPLWLFG